MALIHTLALFLLATEGLGTGTGTSPDMELPPGRPSAIWNNLLLKPAFDETNVDHVVAAKGSTAYINCMINHLGDRAVTWLRAADVAQVLTVNTFTYTSSPRFTAHRSPQGNEWLLKITDTKLNDTGGYECQVSTDPKISLTFNVQVIEAEAEIVGSPEVFVKAGGDIELTCGVPHVTEPPEFILWYHDTNIINYSGKPNLEVVEDVEVNMDSRANSSKLIIHKSTSADSGKYTCKPSNAKEASVDVHIIREEQPAAMQ
ncbi:unnamed protein product, partial [Meganyctiphanes norvegica]